MVPGGGRRRAGSSSSWWRRLADVRGRGLTRFSVAGQGQRPPAGDRGDQVPDRYGRGQPGGGGGGRRGGVGGRARRDCVERFTQPGTGRGEGGDDVTVELGEPVDGRG